MARAFGFVENADVALDHRPGRPDRLCGLSAGAAGVSLRSLVALRSVAIASNVTFIAYASAAHLLPVLLLHAALLPLNLWRLGQFFSSRTRARRVKNRPVPDLERKRS